jgi:hypothetical protein
MTHDGADNDTPCPEWRWACILSTISTNGSSKHPIAAQHPDIHMYLMSEHYLHQISPMRLSHASLRSINSYLMS